MLEKMELTILRNLLCNEPFYRKVIPFLKSEYFNERHEKLIFEEISNFSAKYNIMPTAEVLIINLQNKKDLNEDIFQKTINTIGQLNKKPVEYNWLLDSTEKWCKDRAIYLALLESINIADGGNDKLSTESIPNILQKALTVSFDEHVGHDYFENGSERYEFYHRKEEKIPFHLEYFNKITQGGLPNKTLNVAIGGTGCGKSLFMCDFAAGCISQGKNVLYITLEMSEERIAERIDANLFDVNIREISKIPESIFNNRINEIKRKTNGGLVIKEYPTTSAHAGHFKSLLNELYLKKIFKPDIIFIDYLNICGSSRHKGSAVNSYTYVKSIAEELRGLAVEHNVPVFTATQLTRSGFGSSDPDLTDTSESFGIPATADFMFALVSTEELEKENKIMVKQLKNRYNDPTTHKRFVVGIDRSRMKLYNIDNAENLTEEKEFDFDDLAAQATKNANSKFTNFIL